MNDNIYRSYIAVISEETSSTDDDASARLARSLLISNEDGDMLAMDLLMQFSATEEEIDNTAKLLMKDFSTGIKKQDVLDTWSMLNEKWRDSNGELMLDLSKFESFDELRWLIDWKRLEIRKPRKMPSIQ
jgi:hypothetical protein